MGRQFGHDLSEILTQAAMIEGWGQVLGPAAVALIETDHIEPGSPRLSSDSVHVMRFATAFQTVEQENRAVVFRIALPMTVAEEMGVFCHAEQPYFCRNAS